jgi:hypothetical protein
MSRKTSRTKKGKRVSRASGNNPKTLAYQPGPVFDRTEEAIAKNARAFEQLVGETVREPEALGHALDNFVPVYPTLELKGFPDFPRAWPSWLFVPGKAKSNWRVFWSFGDPSPDQFYSNAWSNSDPSWLASGAVASKENGTLFARSIAQSTGTLWNQSGLGAVYKATYTLAEVSIQPMVLSSMSRQTKVLATSGAPTIVRTNEVAAIYVAAWEINPANRSFSLVQPFSKVIVSSTFHSGLGDTGVITTNNNYNGAPAQANFLAQKGKSYLVSVIAEAWLSVSSTDGSGNPAPLPPSSHFQVWIYLSCNVPRIAVLPRIIYIP